MRKLAVLLTVLLLTTPALAETAAPDTPYKQPFPHSSGADLLPYCEQTGVVVSQLRCDYYVQGVADLATTPQQGKPLACIPQGQNRTQLMQVAINYLQAVKPETLQKQSAASLILKAFTAAFPCPKDAVVTPVPNAETPVVTPEVLEAIKKAMIEAQKKQ